MTDVLTEKTFSRPAFLKGTGALVVGFSLAGTAVLGPKAALAAAKRGDVAGPPDPNAIDSWLEVNADNTVTLYHGKVELGQGTTTGLQQIAAEELDLDMSQVRHVRVDTNITPDQGFTAGSTSISGGGPQVRAAAAEARQALLNLASAKLGVSASALTVSKGVVSGGGQSVKYGELLGGKLFNVKMTGKAPQKPVSQYKLVGTRAGRIEIPDKVTGKYTYMHNVRVPGMLHGRIVRPKGQLAYGLGAKPISVDESSIKNIKGAQVVRKGDFVGVVAAKEFDAIQAAAQLKVKWSTTPDLPTNVPQALRAAQSTASTNVNTGSVDAGFTKATKTVSGTFANAYQTHGMIGPSCAIADVKGDTATVLCSTQLPYSTRGTLATTLGYTNPQQVRLQMFEGSGCYGHSCYDDAAHAAAVLSQAAGKPVRVQFMRWDEHGWDNYAPAQTMDVKAGIDANGKIVAYDYAAWHQGWMSTETSEELVGKKVATPFVLPETENTGAQYAIANRRVTTHAVPSINAGFLKTVWMRAPGAPQALFASEQVIDDLAVAAGMDPIAFRKLNAANDRWAGVLDAAARAANWKPAVPHAKAQSGTVVTGRGVAIGGFSSTLTAIIADISVNTKTGKITATHLYGAQDAGLTVNPGLVENQIEGCLIQGCSRALLEEVKFNKTNVTSLDWQSYPVLRFKDAPSVTPIVVQRTDLPSSGSGEPTTAGVPAAIANAFFDATGKRLRQYPMTPAVVRAALKA
jgi:CO/xanthine dehydrogenase Mo-binding subunit